jgi:hypothetical protein
MQEAPTKPVKSSVDDTDATVLGHAMHGTPILASSLVCWLVTVHACMNRRGRAGGKVAAGCGARMEGLSCNATNATPNQNGDDLAPSFHASLLVLGPPALASDRLLVRLFRSKVATAILMCVTSTETDALRRMPPRASRLSVNQVLRTVR